MPFTPTPADVARIAAMTDLTARNYEVTRGYYQLAQGFRHYLGDDVTWPAFAVWASAQAGRTIRKEDLLRLLERRLGDSPAVRALVEGPLKLGAKRLVEAVLQLDPFERSRVAVSRGNIKVFSEIGGEFARLLQLLETNPTPSQVQDLAATLKPGPPPDGQDYLKLALPLLHQAIGTPPGKRRAELVYYANAAIGFHEQIRLQPEIEASVDGSALDGLEIANRLVDLLLPSLGWFRRLLVNWFLRSRWQAAIAPLVEELRQHVRDIITEKMMVLEVPGAVLRLGHDLPGGFPEPLRSLDDPALRELLTHIDPTPDSLAQTAATSWTSFPERMHFITDLFRSQQNNVRLFEQP